MKPSALQLAARLCRALQNRDDAMVAALLQEGADPNLVLPEGVAAMHLAAGLEQENGTHHHLLCLLLQHGGDPNIRSAEGLTPLHVAASWGRTACLRLLLAEGGHPHLQDQDGSTAVDLAVEQGYERCVSILQDEKWNSSFSQRRAESFLSTITEDAGQTGAGDSPLCPCDGPSQSSLKGLRHCREPCGTFSQPGGAAPDGASGPCTQDRSASSFLTECSWQGDPVLDLSDFSLQPGDPPNASRPLGKPVLSGADVQAVWDGEVGCHPLDTGVKQSWDIRGSAEGECSSARDTARCGPLSLVGTEALLFRPNMPHTVGSPQKTLSSTSLGTKSEPEAGQLHHPQDANSCDPSPVGGSLDPGLLVGLPSQDGLYVTGPDHFGLFSGAESTAVSDLEKIVVDPASVLGVSRILDGRLTKERSLGRCSASSTDRYVSCFSECYTSTVEDPGCSYVQEWEDGKAAPSGSADSCSTSNGGLCCGPPTSLGTPWASGLHGQRTLPSSGAAQIFPGSHNSAPSHSENMWDASQGKEARFTMDPCREQGVLGRVTGGLAEIQGLPVERQGSALSGAREELVEVGMSPRQAEEGQQSLSSQDTVPVQLTQRERHRFQDCGGPFRMSSIVCDTEMALCPTAGVGEEPSSTLDAQLRSMMLATKAAHSPPLSPLNQRCCPAPPWPQSLLTAPLPDESLGSSSLFEEPLELPKRPRQVRRGLGLAAHRGAAKPERSPPSAREAEETEEEEARAISALPRSRKPSLNPGPRFVGQYAASLRRDVGRGGEVPAGRTELEVQQPCQGDAAPDPPELGLLESLGVRGSPGKRVEKTSRVSFSRLSGRGSSAACSPGRLSPISQEVLLSPGGRPMNLSATEPVEYLYVDKEGGHSLIERHIPPTDSSGASSSEDTILYDWQEHAAVGRLANGASAPLNPEYLTDKALARKLHELGADPGPVTPLTRKLYVRLLERLSRQPETPARKGSAAFSPELASALETYRIPNSRADEMALAAEFDRADKSRRWREGLLKSSFNYLLLDPRVTQNLPARCQLLSPADCFRTFVRAVFYVGKGTRGRPYRHLYEALAHYREGQGGPARQVCSKAQHILEIWAGGQGVVSVHCFQNVVPVEAYTREACMVEALGLKMLTNQKKGNYYGQVAGWPMKRRRNLGVFLLHRTLQVFLGEGERQLRPADI